MQADSSRTPDSMLVGEGVFNSVDGFNQASEGRLNRLLRSPLHTFAAKDVFIFLHSKVPILKSFELFWNLSGDQLVSVGPKSIIQLLQTEFTSFPFSAAVEVFKLVQQKVVSDVSLQDVAPLDSNLVQEWSNSEVPSLSKSLSFRSGAAHSFVAPNPTGSPSGIEKIARVENLDLLDMNANDVFVFFGF